MYDELEEMFQEEEVQKEAHRDRNFVETVQVYIGKMLKDKNQNNYHRSKIGTEPGLRCTMALLTNFEVSKGTLHFILPNICERPPPAKSKRIFDALIDKITAIDGGSLFQEAIGRARQKNTVVILHNMEILAKLLAEGKLTGPEVICNYKAITGNFKKAVYFGGPQ
jgi:hypothetical protein